MPRLALKDKVTIGSVHEPHVAKTGDHKNRFNLLETRASASGTAEVSDIKVARPVPLIHLSRLHQLIRFLNFFSGLTGGAVDVNELIDRLLALGTIKRYRGLVERLNNNNIEVFLKQRIEL